MKAQSTKTPPRREYTELFDQRGQPYDRAMRLYPQARREEFHNVVIRANLQPGSRVVDVPAGGGYLQSFLPADSHWAGHEPCAAFLQGQVPLQHGVLLPLPWREGWADAALSIAGVHHLEDKGALFQELARVVRPGGRLVLADVREGSAEAEFLDEFVGRYNSTGHEGLYLNEYTVAELRSRGWCVRSVEQPAAHWRFRDGEALGQFCKLLFDLRGVGPREVLAAAESILGVDREADGVGLRWSLCHIVADRVAG